MAKQKQTTPRRGAAAPRDDRPTIADAVAWDCVEVSGYAHELRLPSSHLAGTLLVRWERYYTDDVKQDPELPRYSLRIRARHSQIPSDSEELNLAAYSPTMIRRLAALLEELADRVDGAGW